jgi:tetratricopeptide (TPR) repeat protein
MSNIPTIAVIQTAWGSKFGGVNSFSTQLCRALVETVVVHRVVCVCFSASAEDVINSASDGVQLVSLGINPTKSADIPPETVLDALRNAGIGAAEWWIGHDVFTGPIAAACREKVPNSRLAVIMHMSYADYAFVKHGPEDAAKIADRAELQRVILSSADIGLAVGPLLFERLRQIRDDRPSVMIVPGLADLAPKVAGHDHVRAVTLGRFEHSESLIKQAPLVVAGFARAFRMGIESSVGVWKAARLRLLGTPNEVATQLRALASAEAGRIVNIEAHEYIENETRLRGLVQECNVSLMLSWHEGFGLSGWEAIGAGVPLVLSRNSGLFQLLDSLGGTATGCVFVVDVRGQSDGLPHEEDKETVKAALLKLAADLPRAQHDARQLRESLRFTHCYTWSRAARSVASALGVQITTTMLDIAFGAPIETSKRDSGTEDVETARRVLASADSRYECGEYIQALEIIESLKGYECLRRTPQLAMDAVLKEAEICMRLNRYPIAMALVRKLAREAKERSDWSHYIRARQVDNVILRDQGHYSEAVELARNLLTIANVHCADRVNSVLRDLARSLALAGLCDEAAEHASTALASAKDKIGEAKAALALGEAHRHGRNDSAAIKWYSQARELSQRAGHVDCFLWSALGLSDSLFLQGELFASEEALDELQAFLKRSGHTHPLETLHIRLSLCALHVTQGRDETATIRDLVDGYQSLDISWPVEYFRLLQEPHTRIPRRF